MSCLVGDGGGSSILRRRLSGLVLVTIANLEGSGSFLSVPDLIVGCGISLVS